MSAIVNVHDLLLQHGHAKARDMVLTKHEKLAIDIAAEIMAEESNKLGFTHSGFCLTSLPHRNPNSESWKKEGYKVTLIIQSGLTKHQQPIGLPYGPKARMILLYLQTKAIQTDTPVVALGDSMHDWLGRMGITGGGSQYREIREQSNRISACTLTFFCEEDGIEARKNGSFVKNTIAFKTPNPMTTRQGQLWQDTVQLDDYFFEQLKAHPFPVWEPALRQLSAKSMAIDLYVWLAYRLHVLEKPMPISWMSLHQQFGGGFKEVKHFKPEFLRNLTLALAAYPGALVEDAGSRGLLLKPSASPIPRNVHVLPSR